MPPTHNIARRRSRPRCVASAGSTCWSTTPVSIPRYGPLAELDADIARKIMEVNVLSALSWSRAALGAGLGADGSGAIVNIASVAGLAPAPGIAYYGVSKAALIGLTVQLAAELSPAVRVNAVAPAVVKTRFAAGALREQGAGSRPALPAATPGRTGGRRRRGGLPCLGRCVLDYRPDPGDRRRSRSPAAVVNAPPRLALAWQRLGRSPWPGAGGRVKAASERRQVEVARWKWPESIGPGQPTRPVAFCSLAVMTSRRSRGYAQSRQMNWPLRSRASRLR